MLDPKKEISETFEIVTRARTLMYEAVNYAASVGPQHEVTRAKLNEARSLLREASSKILGLEKAIQEGRVP